MRFTRFHLYTPLFLLLLLSYSPLPAQYNSLGSNLKSVEKRANDRFGKGAFAEAAALYEQVLGKNSSKQPAMLRLAECYLRLNEPEKAIVWYERGLATPATVQDPSHLLHYAQALAAVGNYPLASVWYQNFLTLVPHDRRATNQLQAIARLEAFKADSARYTIKRLPINSAQADFGPAFYEDGLVFVSGRQTKKPVKRVNTGDQSGFYDLYFSQITGEGQLTSPRKLQQDLSTRLHEGPVAFFDGGKRMIFSQNSENSTAGKGKKLALYEAERAADGKSWINLRPLPFNSNAYSVAHPSISPQGDVLYFASDMPGGYGLTDLYVSRRVNGSWTTPQNLGPRVNTEGNELFPYLHQNTLYFASNGLGGLGGLDIFQLSLSHEGDTPRNMGVPLNSPRDDFGFIINDQQTGYFSTNRLNEHKDDLYWVKLLNATPEASPHLSVVAAPHSAQLRGVLVERQTGKPLTDASVYVLNEATGEELTLRTNEQGQFGFEARLEDYYALMGEKGVNSVFVINLSPRDYAESGTLIRLEASAPSYADKLVIEASLFDSLSHEPVIFAGAFLYEGDEEKQMDYTTLEGKAYFTGSRGRNYWLDIISINYQDRKFRIPATSRIQNDTLKVGIPLQKFLRSQQLVKGIIVREENGTPVSGADIYVLNEATGADQVLQSDSKGEFSFRAIVGDTYLIMGEKQELHVFMPNVAISDPKNEPNQRITLAASRPHFVREVVVEALVMDSITSAPLRLAELEFMVKGAVSKHYTPSSGKAYFSLPVGQAFSVKASLFDYAAQVRSLTAAAPPEQDTVRLRILMARQTPPLLQVQGTVRDKLSQLPLANASIYLLNGKTGDEQLVKSDAAGAFQLQASLDSPYMIMAEKGNRTVFIIDHQFIPAANGQLPSLQLELEAPHFTPSVASTVQVQAQIIDSESRAAVKFAFVKLYKGGQPLELAFADEAGQVRLLLERDTLYEVRLEKHQYTDRIFTLSTHQVAGDSLLQQWEVSRQLPKLLPIAGNVYDLQAAAPLAGATIWILNTTTGEQQQLKADQGGDFTFEASKEHTYTILGEKGGKNASLSNINPEELAENQQKVQLVVQPQQAGTLVIAATVLDGKSGEPVKAASVQLMDNLKPLSSTHTSLKGKSWLTAPAGREYELQLAASQYVSQSIRLSASQLAAADTLAVQVLLQPIERVSIAQAALFLNQPDGKPLAHADVYVLNTTTGEEKKLQTDEKGLVVYPAKSGDTYALLAEKNQARAYLTDVVSTAEGDTLKLLAHPPVQQLLPAKVVARDSESLEAVKLLEVRLSSPGTDPQTLHTSTKGEAHLYLNPAASYLISTRHISYTSLEQVIDIKTQTGDTLLIDLLLEKQLPQFATLELQVIDELSKLPLPSARVIVQNESTGEERVLLANAQGKLSLKAKRSDRYTISSTAEGYSSAKLMGIQAGDREATGTHPLLITVVRQAVAGQTALVGRYDLYENLSGSRQLFVSADGLLYEYQSGDRVLLRNKSSVQVLSNEANSGNRGSLAEEFIAYVDSTSIGHKTFISTIYYDFNKTALTAAAREELQKLAELMKSHPDLSLKINAFTDSRGPQQYNLVLSSQRAQAALDFLVAQGVNRQRISSEGFGESRLLKPCPSPQDCSPADHQLNRRGEFVLNIGQ
ncbi:OmpA family protein [Cesiribacter andamanensis]|uniref:Minor outer membrane protein Omp16 n=1 Tax=Cesiribacter andamanensis AMV16 TaxID=1279009 RepID=M7NI85_9BACT|nr:OmpA family protein [Cesiribacter andamanensis]EMR01515.1 Minor outer membrane protein Omp16 [Cesiribacter andamanensis AMV16]